MYACTVSMQCLKAGCRDLWRAYGSDSATSIIARAFYHGAERVQEVQIASCDSLNELLASAYEGLGAQSRPKKLADALPTVINGAMTEANGWQAATWSRDDLLKACDGDTMVPVEASINGGDYRDLYRSSDSRTQRNFEAGMPVPLSFLLEHMQELDEAPDEDAGEVGGEANKAAKQRHSTRLYLAQRDVADVLPELADAVPLSPPFHEVANRMHQRSIWLGPKGTQTPLHRDPYHNLLCQVWGTKMVRLYSPEHAAKLHPFPNPFLRNTSQVDVLEPLFKDFQEVPFLQCWLKPGQMLLIPWKWWHFVQSVSSSLSISYWWTNDE